MWKNVLCVHHKKNHMGLFNKVHIHSDIYTAGFFKPAYVIANGSFQTGTFLVFNLGKCRFEITVGL